MTDTYPPDQPGRTLNRLPAPGAELTAYAQNIAQLHQSRPMPRLVELYRSQPADQRPALIASGVIWPYGQGVTARWSVTSPPDGYPLRVQRVNLYQSIAEVLAVHGARGDALVDYREPAARPPRDWQFAQAQLAEAFAVIDAQADVLAWGAWWPDTDYAATFAPDRTPFGGTRQPQRTIVYRTVRELHVDLQQNYGPPPRVVWLNGTAGARLAEQVQRNHAEQMRRAETALRLAGVLPAGEAAARQVGA